MADTTREGIELNADLLRGDGYNEIAADMLALLDQRDAMLEALRPMVVLMDMLTVFADGGIREEMVQRADAARAAIAKATGA